MRSEFTYRSGNGLGVVEVKLILDDDDGLLAPETLTIERESDGRMGTFRVVGAPRKLKPLQKLSALPEHWVPSPEVRAVAAADFPSVNLDHETAQFHAYYRGKGQAMKDWSLTWQRWMRETHRRHVEKGWKPKAGAPRAEDPRARWCRLHGITVEEYEARKGDAEWLDRIKRRGVVA